ncbi:MAG: AAA family ATPase [Pseudonocardiaceae bacterium]|nr:AAA family ATPase [Pseudonocardiaceae bacterium]
MPPERAASGPTIGQRMAASRERAFVGRRPEPELFRLAVEADEPPFTVLHVHGPGGIGKSALLRMFAELAGRAGAGVVAVDGHDVAPERTDFRAAAAPAATGHGRTVLLVDTYEAAGTAGRLAA